MTLETTTTTAPAATLTAPAKHAVPGTPTALPPGQLNATTQRLIDDLADTLAAEGFSAAEGGVRGLAAHASALGVTDAAIGVLLDRSEAEIVRLRAFAVVTSQLAALLDCA